MGIAIDGLKSQSVRTPESLDTTGTSQNKFHIRWMIRRDLPEVLDIEKKTTSDNPWNENDFLYTLRHKNVIGMVVEEITPQGKILGFMVSEYQQVSEQQQTSNKNISVIKFAVYPEYQGSGIDTEMVDNLKSKLNPHTRTKILIEVPDSNLHFKEFLDKEGFYPLGEPKSQKHEKDNTTFMEHALKGYETKEDEITALTEQVNKSSYLPFRLALAKKLCFLGKPEIGISLLEKVPSDSTPCHLIAAKEKLEKSIQDIQESSTTEPTLKAHMALKFYLSGNSKVGAALLHNTLIEQNPEATQSIETVLGSLTKSYYRRGNAILSEIVQDSSLDLQTRIKVATASDLIKIANLIEPLEARTAFQLSKLKDDENPDVSQAAQDAQNEIIKSNKTQGLTILETLARDPSSSLNIKISLAIALCIYGDSKVGISILQDLANHPDITKGELI